MPTRLRRRDRGGGSDGWGEGVLGVWTPRSKRVHDKRTYRGYFCYFFTPLLDSFRSRLNVKCTNREETIRRLRMLFSIVLLIKTGKINQKLGRTVRERRG